jgi:hypothetical protein
MFFTLDGAGAKDDGSAWTWEQQTEGGYTRSQTGPLRITLLEDGLRVIGVGADVVVDEVLAAQVAKIVPGSRFARRPVHVIGPQPDLQPRAPMVQLLGMAKVRLASSCIEREAHGKIVRLKRPFILAANSRVAQPSICKIEENAVTVFSEEIKKLFEESESRAHFKAVPFEDEPMPEETEQPAPGRVPSMDELLGRMTK